MTPSATDRQRHAKETTHDGRCAWNDCGKHITHAGYRGSGVVTVGCEWHISQWVERA